MDLGCGDDKMDPANSGCAHKATQVTGFLAAEQLGGGLAHGGLASVQVSLRGSSSSVQHPQGT